MDQDLVFIYEPDAAREVSAKRTAFSPMNTEFYTFGEILWDCLPSGRHAGGAPFNVAAHLVQLGVSASLISAIGQDPLGDEILKVAEDKGVNTQFVTRARIGLPTGTVLVTVDANGNATYELVQPVAWDEIQSSPGNLGSCCAGPRAHLRLTRRPITIQPRSVESPAGNRRPHEILRCKSAPSLRQSGAGHGHREACRCHQTQR